jgi:hypothetical protein
MTIEYFFPKWFYHNSLTLDEVEKIDDLFQNYFNNPNNFHSPPGHGNVRTSWRLEEFDDSNVNINIWNSWYEILQNYLHNFLDEINSSDSYINIIQAWINKYNMNEFQYVHDHCSPDSNIAMVYFHRLNENDQCKFEFHNDKFQLYKLSGLSDYVNMSETSPIFTPNISQGDLILFPSHYLHSVSLHRGSETRISFSANLKISKK